MCYFYSDDLEFWMIEECYMETCCRFDIRQITQHFLIKSLFSEKFFTKRDLVVEEMEETTVKLEKVRYAFSICYSARVTCRKTPQPAPPLQWP